MQGVQLGDTITVDYPDYGITTQAEITSMDYDVLKEQIVSYTLGKGRTSFAQTMLHQDNKIERLDGLVTAKNPIKGL
jgi:phage-related protein